MKSQRPLAAFHFSLTALFSVVACMAIPGYRIWALGSVANLALACWIITTSAQRKLLCGSFVGATVLAAAASYFREPSGRMFDLGVLVLVLLLVVAGFIAYSVYAAETDAA
jgi:hypothetical protein